MKLAVLPNAASRKWNPMTWMLNLGLEKLGYSIHDLTLENLETDRFDLIHLHFFEGYAGFRNPIRLYRRWKRLIRAIDQQKALGARVIYTAHNVVTHDAPWRALENWLTRAFLKRVDGTIFVSEASVPLVRKQWPELQGPSTIIPLSDYGDWYPSTLTKEEARNHFGISSSTLVLCNVGLIKRYKNVPELIRAFSGLPGDLALLIGGRVLDADLRAEIEGLAAEDHRVKLELRHLDDDDMQLFMRAADAAVLPYRNILNSGSAMLALTFDRPVVVPNVGSMPELQRRINASWVHLFDGEFDKLVLQQAIEWVRNEDRPAKPPLEDLTVASTALKHDAFYRLVIGTKIAKS